MNKTNKMFLGTTACIFDKINDYTVENFKGSEAIWAEIGKKYTI